MVVLAIGLAVFGVKESVRAWQMRRDIIWLCKEAIHADRHISEGEARFLRQLRAAWKLSEHPDWVRPRGVIRLVRAHRE